MSPEKRRRFAGFDQRELDFFIRRKYGPNQFDLLSRAIQRSDPRLEHAFTPERALEYLAREKTKEIRNFVGVLNARIESLTGQQL